MSRAGATGASCTDGAVRGSSGRRKWLPTPLRKLSHNKLTATPSLSAGELPPVAGRPLPPKPPLKKTNSERKVQVSASGLDGGRETVGHWGDELLFDGIDGGIVCSASFDVSPGSCFPGLEVFSWITVAFLD